MGDPRVSVLSNISNIRNVNGVALPILCPGCNRIGTLAPIGQDVAFNVPGKPGQLAHMAIGVGHRQCPDPKCATHVFVAYSATDGRPIGSYPVGRIEFDTTDVPEKVRSTFNEALTCAAHECYVGAGMLIRKTLEAVCEERSAAGNNLKEKISDLKNKVTLPTALFDALDHLRLLGNDAAHIEAKSYDEVGKEEVAAGIDLTKEIIKATYQYKTLVQRLLALKK
jgi:hypothetical protein